MTCRRSFLSLCLLAMLVMVAFSDSFHFLVNAEKWGEEIRRFPPHPRPPPPPPHPRRPLNYSRWASLAAAPSNYSDEEVLAAVRDLDAQDTDITDAFTEATPELKERYANTTALFNGTLLGVYTPEMGANGKRPAGVSYGNLCPARNDTTAELNVSELLTVTETSDQNVSTVTEEPSANDDQCVVVCPRRDHHRDHRSSREDPTHFFWHLLWKEALAARHVAYADNTTLQVPLFRVLSSSSENTTVPAATPPGARANISSPLVVDLWAEDGFPHRHPPHGPHDERDRRWSPHDLWKWKDMIGRHPHHDDHPTRPPVLRMRSSEGVLIPSPWLRRCPAERNVFHF